MHKLNFFSAHKQKKNNHHRIKKSTIDAISSTEIYYKTFIKLVYIEYSRQLQDENF